MRTKIFSYIKMELKRLEPYARADLVYLARGSFWTTVGFIINSLLGLGLVLVLGNFIQKDVYGTYKYIMSLVGGLSFLMFLGINTAVTHASALGKRGVLDFAEGAQQRWNVRFTLAVLGIAIYYATQGNYTLGLSLGILSFGASQINIYNTFGAYLNGRRLFKRATLYGLGISIFYTATMTAAAIYIGNTIALVSAYILGMSIPLFFFYYKTKRQEERGEMSELEKKEAMAFAKRLNLLSILSNASQYIDKVVVFHFLGAVELAVYGFALAIPERIRGYFKNISSLMLPKLTTRSKDSIAKVFYFRIFQGLLVGLIISGGYIVFAPYIFDIALSQYKEAIPYSQIIAISFIFTVPGSYVGDIFRAQRMIRELSHSSIFGHSSRIILFLLLGSMWGVWGVVIAAQVAAFLGFFYNIFLWENRQREESLETSQ